MSTWRNVGITYLKYADMCATHVRNALKDPAKSKAKSSSNMHARIVQWDAGKRGEPRELHLSPFCVAPPPPCTLAQAAAHTLAIVHIPGERGCTRSDTERGGLPGRLQAGAATDR